MFMMPLVCLPNTIFVFLYIYWRSYFKVLAVDNFVAFKLALTFFGRHRASTLLKRTEIMSQVYPFSKVRQGNRIKNSSLLNLCYSATRVPHFQPPVTDDLGSCPD